MAKGEALV